MAKNKDANTIQETTINTPQKWIERLSNRYIIFRSFLGLTFITLAFSFFTPLLRIQSDWAKLALVVFGVIVLVLCLLIAVEYVIKIVKLQNNNVRNYSALVSINTFLGIIIPLIYANLVLNTVIRALGRMLNYGTFLCEIRYNIVNFYHWNNVYYLINQLVAFLVILVTLLFIFGGFIEKLQRNNRRE